MGTGQRSSPGNERKQDFNPGSTAQMDNGSELMGEEKTYQKQKGKEEGWALLVSGLQGKIMTEVGGTGVSQTGNEEVPCHTQGYRTAVRTELSTFSIHYGGTARHESSQRWQFPSGANARVSQMVYDT